MNDLEKQEALAQEMSAYEDSFPADEPDVKEIYRQYCEDGGKKSFLRFRQQANLMHHHLKHPYIFGEIKIDELGDPIDRAQAWVNWHCEMCDIFDYIDEDWVRQECILTFYAVDSVWTYS